MFCTYRDPVFSTRSRVFHTPSYPSEPVFSTSHVSHKIPCFKHPVFSTPHALHTRDPVPQDPGPAFSTRPKQNIEGQTRCLPRITILCATISYIALLDSLTTQLDLLQSPLLQYRRNISFPANSYTLKRQKFHISANSLG